MKTIILAAGYGTRLKKITKKKPKALLEIKGRPVLDYIVEKIPKEIKKIYLVTNDKFFSKFEEWSKTKNIFLINDKTKCNEERLGALGDLELCIKKIGLDDFLVLASDNLFNFELQEPYDFFKEIKKDVVVLYDIKNKERAKFFGVIEIDENKKIVNFAEKPSKPETTFVSCGIYFLTKKSVFLLEKYIKEGNSLEGPGNFIGWLSKIRDVYGFLALGKWYDIGNLRDYEEAKSSWN